MSALTLERLQFDASNPTDGPLMGSYLIAADGTVLTDSGSSGALDVYLQNSSIAVTGSSDSVNIVTSYSPDTPGTVSTTV